MSCCRKNCLQSSAVNRVWHGVAKWSDSLSYSKSLLPVQISTLPASKQPRPSHYLHHACQMVSGTPPASFHLFCVSQMLFCVIQNTTNLDSSVHNTFFYLPLSNVCDILPIFIFSFYWPVSDIAFSLPLCLEGQHHRVASSL